MRKFLLVIWRNVIRSLLRALLPIAIVPGLFAMSIIYYFGLTLDAVLIMIMVAQFYIIWVQVEVSLRQTRLSELEYEPILLVKLHTITDSMYHTTVFEIKLKNDGEYPAYNVTAHISSPLLFPLEGTFRLVGDIESKDEKTIYTLDGKEFEKYSEFAIDVDYNNALGQYGGLTFNFDRKFMLTPLTIRGHAKMPGILLNSIEDLRSLYGLLTLNRRIKRFREMSEKP